MYTTSTFFIMSGRELIKKDNNTIMANAFKPTDPKRQVAFQIQGARGTKFAFIGPDGGATTEKALKLGLYISERG